MYTYKYYIYIYRKLYLSFYLQIISYSLCWIHITLLPTTKGFSTYFVFLNSWILMYIVAWMIKYFKIWCQWIRWHCSCTEIFWPIILDTRFGNYSFQWHEVKSFWNWFLQGRQSLWETLLSNVSSLVAENENQMYNVDVCVLQPPV